MPRGGRGGGFKKSHKGRHRQFTNEEELRQQALANEKDRQWRQKKGLIDSDEEEEEEEQGAKSMARGNPGDLPPSSSEEEDSSDEEDDDGKPKGVEHLIEVENPNRAKNKLKKVTDMDVQQAAEGEPRLSRREREEIEKQKARANYMKLHAEGKTDEARADLARLALIRKQREDAAKKKEAEKQEREAKAAAAAAEKNKRQARK